MSISDRHDLKKLSRAPINAFHDCIFEVKQRNSDKIGALLTEIYSPNSPKYRKYLSSEELHELTSNPTSTMAVHSFLRNHNISVVKSSYRGDFVTARGSILVWERLLRGSFYEYDRKDYKGNTITPVFRSEVYTIPTELEEHVVSIFNTVDMPLLVRKHGVISTQPNPVGDTGPPIIQYGAVTPALLNRYCECIFFFIYDTSFQ